MVTVIVPCIDCGDREVTVTDCSVRVNPWQDFGYVMFPCDGCEKNIERSITPEGVSILVDAGVRLFIPERSDELDERMRLREGGPIGFLEYSEAYERLLNANDIADLWDRPKDKPRDIKNI